MQFIHELMISFSTIVFLIIVIYSFKYRRVSGAFPLFIQMIAAVIWTLSSFFEISSTSLEIKVLWRNFQQIGVFIMPVSSLFFAIDYTKQTKLRKLAYIISAIPITALLLIFTNEFHHIMRSGYMLVDRNMATKFLVVNSTIIGATFVLLNNLIQVLSILILFDFASRVSGRFRKQVYTVIMSIVIVFLLTLIRVIYLQPRGIYIPLAVLYLPSVIILFYSVFRYKIFIISPIARDKVFDVIQEGIIVVDLEGNIVDVNSYAINLLNKFMSIEKDIIGSKIGGVFKEIPQLAEMIFAGKEIVREIGITVEQNNYYISFGIFPFGVDNKNDKIGTVIIINDITQSKIYEMDLKVKADRDGLTGLLNRSSFTDIFNKLLNSISFQSKLLTVFMIDLDRFKKVNDTYGHINGDKVLQHFAGILNETLRAEDIIGRIGGEEFAVVLPNIHENEAFIVAERIRRKVEESNLYIMEGQIIKYTVSIGIADNCDSNLSQEQLLHRADLALYEAKKVSRNCTIIYRNLKS